MLTFRFGEKGSVLVREMEGVGRFAGDPRALLEDFQAHMLEHSIPTNFTSGGRPSWGRSDWTSEKVQLDTTRLMKSVQGRVSGPKLELGSNLAYAAQRQFGGVVKAKGKALAIPLPNVPRSMRRPRRWGDRLFKLKPTKGDPNTVGVLVSKDRDGGVTPRFVLRKSVRQPARPFVLFQDEDIAYVSRRLVEMALDGAS